MAGIFALPVVGMPMFEPGMSIAREVFSALASEAANKVDHAGETLRDGDVCVVAQKIVSKAEGRLVSLAQVTPSDEAKNIAAQTQRDAAMIQLILDESSAILRAVPPAIIARHLTGHVLANAGIDASNVSADNGDTVLLWPRDPDASARAIRKELRQISGASPAVLIADSMGRAWRIGTVGNAIGCAGLTVLDDQRGIGKDLFGRTLQATVIAVADAIAGIATLAMGEGDERTPAAIVRGADRWVTKDDGPGAASGLRPVAEDMFR